MDTQNFQAIDFLLGRRSAAQLTEPGPTREQLELILQAGATVPDHGKLKPYRFVVVQGDARARFGDALAAAAVEQTPDLGPPVQEKLRQKAFFAPALVALIFSPRAGAKIPEWEQLSTASCTGYAIALAAHALGLGAVWKTANALDGAQLRALLALSAGERLLGWVNLGHHTRPLPAGRREPVDLATLATAID